MREYGLTNPLMDETLEAEIREQNPNMSDNGVNAEMNRLKKKATLFNAMNTKAQSSKRVKGVNNGR